jgi:hypothetical protein
MRKIERVIVAQWISTEGCISARQSGGRHHLRVTIVQSDSAPLDRIRDWVGHGTVSAYQREWSTIYTYRLNGRFAGQVLQECLPYMIHKQDQARLGIELASRPSHARREEIYRELRILKGRAGQRTGRKVTTA